ncbi:hypothetical protein BH10PSE19_BH10PSE19_00620 [soil metagenome]
MSKKNIIFIIAILSLILLLLGGWIGSSLIITAYTIVKPMYSVFTFLKTVYFGLEKFLTLLFNKASKVTALFQQHENTALAVSSVPATVEVTPNKLAASQQQQIPSNNWKNFTVNNIVKCADKFSIFGNNVLNKNISGRKDAQKNSTLLQRQQFYSPWSNLLTA